MTEKRPWDSPRADCIVVFLAAILPFLGTLWYPFLNWDDDRYVTANPWLGGVSFAKVAGALTHSYYFNYHPLTIWSYMVNDAIHGPWAPGYRAVNILLHGIASLGVLAFLKRSGAARFAAVALAIFFAVNPLRLESVVWISERKDVLCGALYAWALAEWAKSNRAAPWSAVILFVAALMAKAMAVSFPLVVLLYDLCLRRQVVKKRIPLYLAMFAISAFFAWMNVRAQGGAISSELSLGQRVVLSLYAPAHYLITTIDSALISPYYPLADRPTRTVAGIITGLTVCAAALAAVAWFWKRNPRISFGLLAAAAALGPVAGLVGVGAAFAADRYSYMPTIPFLLAVAVALNAIYERNRIAILATPVVLVGYALATVILAPAWSGSIPLWERALARYPNSSEPRINLADAWSIAASANPAEAEKNYNTALSIFPADGKAVQARADAFIEAARWTEADETLAAALKESRIRPVTKSYALAMRALCAQKLGHPEDAAAFAREAFDPAWLKPQTVGDLLFLGYSAERIGDLKSAGRLYSQALEMEPVNTAAMQNLAFVYIAEARAPEAIALMQEAAAIAPNDPELQHNLAAMIKENGQEDQPALP
ncbi:tetratricopeptide repeat protein [soil metagenome]